MSISTNGGEPIAVLLHLATLDQWDDFYSALEQLDGAVDIYVNLVTGLNAPDVIQQQYAQVRDAWPEAIILLSENRGMDTGGMMRMFSRVIEKQYRAVLYLHSKSSDQWRRGMLTPLIDHQRRAVQAINSADASAATEKVGMAGSWLYPFDYYNIGPFLALAEQLELPLETSWERYFERFKKTRNLPLDQLLAHARDMKLPVLRPEVDLRYAEEMLGELHHPEQPMNRDLLKRFNVDGVLGPLPYFPGNFFWISPDLIRQLAKKIDFEEEFRQLPRDLASDREIQSRAHAWERILPVFAIKNGFSLMALGAGG